MTEILLNTKIVTSSSVKDSNSSLALSDPGVPDNEASYKERLYWIKFCKATETSVEGCQEFAAMTQQVTYKVCYQQI